MRVFKSTYNDSSGKRRETGRWYVEFRDHMEIVRRLAAFTHRGQSEELGRKLVRLVGYRVSGEQPDPVMARWLETIPPRMRVKLMSWSLLDARQVAASKALSDHLDDFRTALRSKDNTERHVVQVTTRVRRIIDDCGFKFFSDIVASKVQSFLADLRRDTKDRRGISAQTYNFYISNIKQFCRWMVRDGRALSSPVDHLHPLNVRTDRRHDRRALSVDELRRLLDAAGSGPDWINKTRKNGHILVVSGRERRMLYRLAVETGLRRGELAGLTRSSFNLDGDTPTVTVAASYSKHRREDVLPLRADTAAELKAFLGLKAPGAIAFNVPTRHQAARMIRRDLEAAKVPYKDAAGRVADFHSLRHTFITNLASAQVHPKVAQSLARHCSITLTMDRFSHTCMPEMSAAIDKLPDLSKPAAGSTQEKNSA